MSDPTFEDQLLGLPPKVKLIGGLVMAVGGGFAFWWLWGAGWFSGLAMLVTGMGLALLLTGRSELARERAFDREVERAHGEFDDLAAGAIAARQQGRSVARFLQDRGFKDFGIRRWLAGLLEEAQTNVTAFAGVDDAPPISATDLRELFDRLEEIRDGGYECDHTFARTRRFLAEKRQQAEPMLEWLGRHGAGCDCEVTRNVAGKWGAAVGRRR